MLFQWISIHVGSSHMLKYNKSTVVRFWSDTIFHCCVRPTSKRLFMKIAERPWNTIHLMPCRNSCSLYNHLAITYSVGLSSLFHQWECLKCNGHGPSVSCVKWALVIRMLPHSFHSGPLHTRAKSRDHEVVRAPKKVSKGCSKTPSKSCSVVTGFQVYCEVIGDQALNQMLFQWISIQVSLHTW